MKKYSEKFRKIPKRLRKFFFRNIGKNGGWTKQKERNNDERNDQIPGEIEGQTKQKNEDNEQRNNPIILGIGSFARRSFGEYFQLFAKP